MFCMGNPKRKDPTDVVKLYFDDYRGQDAPPVSQQEIDELQAEMAAINRKMKSAKD